MGGLAWDFSQKTLDEALLCDLQALEGVFKVFTECVSAIENPTHCNQSEGLWVASHLFFHLDSRLPIILKDQKSLKCPEKAELVKDVTGEGWIICVWHCQPKMENQTVQSMDDIL